MALAVIEVVLPVDRCTLGCQEVRDRIADRDPTTAPGVQRARGIGRHEFEIDVTIRQRLGGAVRGAAGDDLRHFPGNSRCDAVYRSLRNE